jgi:hypothetical protein
LRDADSDRDGFGVGEGCGVNHPVPPCSSSRAASVISLSRMELVWHAPSTIC